MLDPQWECFVDQISIGAADPFPYAENNWVFCSQPTLNDGPHTLTINATVREKQTFWLDQIQYTPSKTESLENEYVVVSISDPVLNYGTGWETLGGTANMTRKKGSLLEFDFVGSSFFYPTY